MTRDSDALGTWLIRRLEDVGGETAPDPDLVVAYAEGRLSGEERDIVEARLAESDAGRALLEALMDAGAVEARVPRAPARGRLLKLAVLSAAAILLVAVGIKASGILERKAEVVPSGTLLASAFDAARTADPDLFESLRPLSSDELAAAGPGPERGGMKLWEPAFVVTAPGAFRWEAVEGATTYLLKVSDEQGQEIYTARSLEPVHGWPPDALRVNAGQVYLWEVETRTQEGNTVKGRKTFTVAGPEVYRPYRKGLELLQAKANPRIAKLAEAHLAIRYELWVQARLSAQAHVRNHPGDEAGRVLLERIHRQLGMPKPENR
ncbi:MAG: hypothetical protein QNJ98_19175 [Planctomycetota bacterium]|nr:hypothetical protein [Planctomycetota bacterium]